jgi:hypothetical protein
MAEHQCFRFQAYSVDYQASAGIQVSLNPLDEAGRCRAAADKHRIRRTEKPGERFWSGPFDDLEIADAERRRVTVYAGHAIRAAFQRRGGEGSVGQHPLDRN